MTTTTNRAVALCSECGGTGNAPDPDPDRYLTQRDCRCAARNSDRVVWEARCICTEFACDVCGGKGTVRA